MVHVRQRDTGDARSSLCVRRYAAVVSRGTNLWKRAGEVEKAGYAASKQSREPGRRLGEILGCEGGSRGTANSPTRAALPAAARLKGSFFPLCTAPRHISPRRSGPAYQPSQAAVTAPNLLLCGREAPPLRHACLSALPLFFIRAGRDAGTSRKVARCEVAGLRVLCAWTPRQHAASGCVAVGQVYISPTSAFGQCLLSQQPRRKTCRR